MCLCRISLLSSTNKLSAAPQNILQGTLSRIFFLFYFEFHIYSTFCVLPWKFHCLDFVGSREQKKSRFSICEIIFGLSCAPLMLHVEFMKHEEYPVLQSLFYVLSLQISSTFPSFPFLLLFFFFFIQVIFSLFLSRSLFCRSKSFLCVFSVWHFYRF